MATVRIIQNNMRISTGKPWKNVFLQVFPEVHAFNSEDAWKSFWAAKEEHVKREAVKGEEPIKMRLRSSSKKTAEKAEEPVKMRLRSSPKKKAVEKPTKVQTTAWAPRSHDSEDKPINVKEISVPHHLKEEVKNWTHRRTEMCIIPAGRYYIGDLCYALPDTIYDYVFGGTVYDAGFYKNEDRNTFFFLGNTYAGDGDYKGSDGFHYSVDSGTIGICPVELLTNENHVKSLGKVYSFKGPVQCSAINGVFKFYSLYEYHLIIDTH